MVWSIVILYVSGVFVTVPLVEIEDYGSCKLIAKELRMTKPKEVKTVSCVPRSHAT